MSITNGSSPNFHQLFTKVKKRYSEKTNYINDMFSSVIRSLHNIGCNEYLEFFETGIIVFEMTTIHNISCFPIYM